jgi:hypothetical protein
MKLERRILSFKQDGEIAVCRDVNMKDKASFDAIIRSVSIDESGVEETKITSSST